MEYFYIWSAEHTSWWSPMGMGYTNDLTKAGKFDRAKAIEICLQANFSGIEEIPVPVEIMDHIRSLQ